MSTLPHRRLHRARFAAVAGLLAAGPAFSATTPAGADAGPDATGQYVVHLSDDDGGVEPLGAGGLLSAGGVDVEVEREGVLASGERYLVVEASPAEAEALAADPGVSEVEQDQPLQLHGVQDRPPAWGLDRIDQRALPLDATHRYDTTGAGVTIYVVDSGLRPDHADFTGRVRRGYSTVDGDAGTTDCHGHGTHVAGTAAGSRHGVAKGATVVPVRIFDCAGNATGSDLLEALQWIRKQPRTGPAVVNLSMGGGASAKVDSEVAALVDAGMVVVVSAGNSAADACSYSPAREPRAITVGATTDRDARAPYSNTGRCLDLFAPGSAIRSADHRSTTGTVVMSGTSMAAPHVTGVVARILQREPSASPARVAELVLGGATAGAITDAGTGSPNRLLHLAAVEPAGYWMLRADGGLHSFGTAAAAAAAAPTVAFDAVPGGGLWVLRRDGVVEARGPAPHFGSVRAGTLPAGERVATISALPDGSGYWVFTERGRVLPFGSARSHGDVAHLSLNGPIVASAPSSTGQGYYMVASDGGVFAFGDAPFHGSTGHLRLNQPVVGVAPARSGAGYWLVAADGGVFAFGAGAPFRGSVPGVLQGRPLNRPVIGGIAYGDGYVMVASDGGAFVFSDADFKGSLGGTALPAPVVGLTVAR